MLDSFVAFLSVSAVVIASPGPDTAVTVGSALSGGRRGGTFTALGVFCGQAVWTLAASAGISALLVASEPAFLAVRYAGATYLVFVGLQAIKAARRRQPGGQSSGSPSELRHGSMTYWRRGLLSDLGNPKMAVFFTSLLPQFGSDFAELMLLGLIFCAMTFLWLAVYAMAIAQVSRLLGQDSIRRALDAATGVILVVLGARVATEPR